MGQYWKVCNLDKQECLRPHGFDDGAKFGEFAFSGGGTMAGLAVLLAAPESMGSGGGDIRRSEVLGRWAGDRIVILGDYNSEVRYAGMYDNFRDISATVWPEVEGYR